MAGYGWVYLTVTHVQGGERWLGSDRCEYASEAEMLRELGVTGWELVICRETPTELIYYFKRPRA